MIRQWTEVPLGAIATDLTKDRTHVIDPEEQVIEPTIRTKEHKIDVAAVRIGAEVKIKARVSIAPGDLVFSRLHTQNGGFAFADRDFLATGTFMPLAVDESKVDRRFLFWALHVRVPSISATSDSVGRETYKSEQILAIPIPLPPFSEQRRIVAKVEDLAAKIEEARRLRNQSVNESEALAHSISRKVFRDTGKFCLVQLKEVCSEIIDCLHSNPIYSELGIPTVRSPDVGWGKLFLKGAKKTSEQEYRRRTSRGEPKPGDIILVREGGGTGKAGIVEEGQQISLGQRVMQLRPNKEKVLPRFLLHQWLSPLIQEDQIGEMMKGSASPHLNIGSLKKFNFILTPIEEQRHIVAHLDRLQAKADVLKALQTQTTAELDALLPSILDKAFKGEL